ncbi:MAG: DUF2500 domain-containing protein [Planctomycetes bacterium]|nr:DUF2500 domain-containing protein [Planctomycetota bacterium]
MGVGILALGLMLGFAGCGERGQDSSAPPFLIAGTILALSGLFAFRSARVRQRLPVRRDFRAVAGKRTCVSGGEPTTTDYFVTLESCSGARKEHSASATLYGQVAEGDLGVADVHGGELVRFRRFELDA